MNSVAKNIKRARVLSGLSQKELGEKINREHNTISTYESGRQDVPDEILEQIANALGVSISVLKGVENPTGIADVRTRQEIADQNRESELISIISKQQNTISDLVAILKKGV